MPRKKFDPYDDDATIGECSHEWHPGEVSVGRFAYKGCWTCWQWFSYTAPVIEKDTTYDGVESLKEAFEKDGRGRLFVKEIDLDLIDSFVDGGLSREEASKPMEGCWLITKAEVRKRKKLS